MATIKCVAVQLEVTYDSQVTNRSHEDLYENTRTHIPTQHTPIGPLEVI